MKTFEEFIEEGVVTKQSHNSSRAKSLKIESKQAKIFLKEIISKIGVKDDNSNNIIKICYDIIMDLIRAKMIEKGFNASGHGAHEAEVSYLRELNFKEQEVKFADQLRYFRNRIMYYGKSMDSEYAKKVIKFLEEIYSKLE